MFSCFLTGQLNFGVQGGCGCVLLASWTTQNLLKNNATLLAQLLLYFIHLWKRVSVVGRATGLGVMQLGSRGWVPGRSNTSVAASFCLWRQPKKKPLQKTRIKLHNTLALRTIKARDARRITAGEMKYMRKTAGYAWTDYKTNAQISKELKITHILDKLLE